MPAPELIDAVSASLLATDFAHSLATHRANAEFAANHSRLGYLSGLEKLGVREAQAMQEVRTSAQSREILQARSAMNQPQGG